MPSSPCEPGRNTWVASPAKISPSALTMSTWMVSAIARSAGAQQSASGEALRFLDGLFDATDHVEGLLGQVIVLTGDDGLEAADRVLQRHDLAVLAGEHLGHVEGLREEALDLACTIHDELVLLGELVHAENGDDVL